LWTDATGDGLWNTAGNWYDTVTHVSVVPGPGDYVLFSPGMLGVGSNDNCTVNGNVSVDRVIMDSSYTGTLTVPDGASLSTTNSFSQYGTLALYGMATVQIGTNAYIQGTVTTGFGMGPKTATLAAQGPMWIYSSAQIITNTSMGSGGTSLLISAGAIDDWGTIRVGTSTTPGSLTLSGAFTEEQGADISVFSGSVLTFDTRGNPAAETAFLKGTLNLNQGATVVNPAVQLGIDGGTLNSQGAASTGNIITGDVAVFNYGVINIGAATQPSPSTLSLTGGSLTVGSLIPNGSATGGTLNVYANSVLSFPSAAGVRSTFVVQGAVEPKRLGVVNLYGGTISMDTSRVAAMDLEGSEAVLNSYGGGLGSMTGPDQIIGNLFNNGVIQFGGNLHALTVTGNYVQMTGTLVIRLANGTGDPNSPSPSDQLTVGGVATLDGTLTLNALENLTPGQRWGVLSAQGGIVGDFSVVGFPADGNPNWRVLVNPLDVEVDN
jgi:hypothetical protein